MRCDLSSHLLILRGLLMSMQSMSPIGMSSSLSSSLLLSRSTEDVSLFEWRSRSAEKENNSNKYNDELQINTMLQLCIIPKVVPECWFNV